MAKRKAKAKPKKGTLGTEQIKALTAFCEKHGVEIKTEDKFNLYEFLLALAVVTMKLVPTALGIERKVGKLLQKEGEDSENFGGSPLGGSTVTLDLKEDPYTGISLADEEESEGEDEEGEDEEPENDSIEDDDEGDEDEDGDSDDEDEAEEDDDSDEDGDDDEGEDADEDEDDWEDDDDSSDDDDDDDSDDGDDSDEDEGDEDSEDDDSDDDDDDSSDSDDDEEDEDDDDSDDDDDDEGSGDEDDDESEDKEDDDSDDDEETLSKAKKKAKGKAEKKSKKELKEEKDAARNARRAELKEQLPTFGKKPEALKKLSYQDLLMVAALCGSKQPMSIGKADNLREFIQKKLKSDKKAAKSEKDWKGTGKKKKKGKK